MSGGSFDYAYSKLDRVTGLADTLEEMARRCKEWAVSAHADKKYVDGKWEPTTFEDRAAVVARALILEDRAAKLRTALGDTEELSTLMQEVEWVASSDSGIDSLMGPLTKKRA